MHIQEIFKYLIFYCDNNSAHAERSENFQFFAEIFAEISTFQKVLVFQSKNL